jgi:hypothetical protein
MALKEYIEVLRIGRVAPVAAVLLASACTMAGTGIGQSPVPGATATFSWSAQGPRTGTMTAMLADGRRFDGSFFQITRETRVEELGPLWRGWRAGPGWRRGGWGYWEPNDQFITHYSGRVLANLSGPAGQMRCRFILVRPASGMAAGGQGQCQLSDRTRIQARFAPH